MDYIKRDDAIDAVNNAYSLWQAEKLIEMKRSADVVERKRGEWEYHSNPSIRGGINPEDAYCSCCGFHVLTSGDIDFDEYNFCPNCGADMRGEP